jgi:hypothetical protein
VVAAVAAGSDAEIAVAKAPFDGTVTGVTYVPKSTITGANTDSRTISLLNKGQAGSGTTAVASLALTNGVNATGFDEKALTLSVTAADLVVADGDILSFKSLHVGSTGLADPGGTVFVEFTRS